VRQMGGGQQRRGRTGGKAAAERRGGRGGEWRVGCRGGCALAGWDLGWWEGVFEICLAGVFCEKRFFLLCIVKTFV
jgi:hypothetical protein